MDKNTKPTNASGSVKGNTSSYVAGFVLSLLLTLVAYTVTARYSGTGHSGVLSRQFFINAVIALAVVQLLVQMVFFLHLDRESKPRWNLLIASFAAIVVLILVAGSLWIMNNLNYHTQAVPSDKSIIKDEGLHGTSH